MATPIWNSKDVSQAVATTSTRWFSTSSSRLSARAAVGNVKVECLSATFRILPAQAVSDLRMVMPTRQPQAISLQNMV